MNVTKIFSGLVVTLIAMMGTVGFMTSLGENAGVDTNKTISVEEDFNKFKDNINDNDPSTTQDLKTKLTVLSDPTEDFSSTISAGLSFVPKVIKIILSPISFVHGYIDSVAVQIPQLPGWVSGGLKLLFDVALLLAVVGMYLRYKP